MKSKRTTIHSLASNYTPHVCRHFTYGISQLFHSSVFNMWRKNSCYALIHSVTHIERWFVQYLWLIVWDTGQTRSLVQCNSANNRDHSRSPCLHPKKRAHVQQRHFPLNQKAFCSRLHLEVSSPCELLTLTFRWKAEDLVQDLLTPFDERISFTVPVHSAMKWKV